MLRAVIVAVPLLGACSYRPGSFAHAMTTFPGTRVVAGCLDVAVDRRQDYDGTAVLAYSFGNRCEKRQVVDLVYATVIGRDEAGDEHVLQPFDPRGEILPLEIDAALAGREVLAYAWDGKLLQVCVDVASIAKVKPAQWVCLARKDDPVTPQPTDARPPSDQTEPEPDRTLIDNDAGEQAGLELRLRAARATIDDAARKEAP